jgi:hypothetical protein
MTLHPDLCRTIKKHDRARRGRNQIYPSQKRLDSITTLLTFGKRVMKLFKWQLLYRPTKGWLIQRRTD